MFVLLGLLIGGIVFIFICILDCTVCKKNEEEEELDVHDVRIGRDAFLDRLLPLFKWNKNMCDEYGQEECIICMESFRQGAEVSCSIKPNACSHIFHTKCISLWLLKHSDCPTCRSTFLGSKESRLFLSHFPSTLNEVPYGNHHVRAQSFTTTIEDYLSLSDDDESVESLESGCHEVLDTDLPSQ